MQQESKLMVVIACQMSIDSHKDDKLSSGRFGRMTVVLSISMALLAR